MIESTLNVEQLLQAVWETVYMTFVSLFFAAIFGLLIGILLCIAVMFISTALPHAICARLKVEQVFHFYWTFVTGFALAGLLLVWAGV